MESVIDNIGIDIDIVWSGNTDGEDAVASFVDEYGTGLSILALHIANLEKARQELADDGAELVGEISAGGFSEYPYHPSDFDGLFVFLVKLPLTCVSNKRLQALGDPT